MYTRYPILLTFGKNKHCTVASQFTDAWHLDLHPNLSQAVNFELADLLRQITTITPNTQLADTRSVLMANTITTSYFYRLTTFAGLGWAPYTFVWDPIIPKKHSVFLWLAFKDRLNTRYNKIKKHWTITSHASCESCTRRCGGPDRAVDGAPPSVRGGQWLAASHLFTAYLQIEELDGDQ